MNLSDIIDNAHTDKNTVHSYLPTYQELFSKKRENAKNILEIGIFNGGSIKLWHDFFINATIYGLDNEYCPNAINEIRNNDRIKLHTLIDAYDTTFFNSQISHQKFDVIIDDGPHTLESMIQFITLYSQVLADDGILIIEDVQDWSWIEMLRSTVPIHLQPYIKTYDLRSNKNRWDDILFVIDLSNK